ncbi:hypothetical protein SADUNF_Sadunf06G0220500 [Salix dunnii]|uniref:Uncharacterized protein n=1 Tax=Salix dunnii TaxID=1413687 RepID=A0A835K641_9ROSI|nr:hypothetical protein SADUNF_Sadunf06G0220500 [Salix dunnii]
MESNRKRKGFMKGKLMLFYHRSPPKLSSNAQYCSKVKPSQTSPTTASVGYFDKFFGVVGDVSVDDTKATRYISSVQEHFKLERINSERKQQLEAELQGLLFMEAKFCQPVS